jgi:hypothetical protein
VATKFDPEVLEMNRLKSMAVIATFLVVAVLLSSEWIEGLTGFDPDTGNGSVELCLAFIALVALAIALAACCNNRFIERPSSTAGRLA